MGRLFFVLLILSFLVLVFFQSNTMEVTYTTTTDETNIEYSNAHYSLHWDRFVDYLGKLPRELEGKVRSVLGK